MIYLSFIFQRFKKIVLVAHIFIIFAFAALLIILVALDLSDEK